MAEAGRTKKSLINSMFGLVSYIVILLLTFFSQRIFVKILGYEILGLNSLLNTVISTLSIAELGIATAISFSLYKPLAENDERKVAAIISLFRRIYIIIAAIIAVAGAAAIPLLPILTKHAFTLGYLLPLYFVFLFNTLISYLFTYNHTLAVADQKNYIIAITNALTRIALIGLQIAVLYIWADLLIFLVVMLVTNTVSNILLAIFISRKYPYLKKYKRANLDAEDTKNIKTNVFALLYHRIGNYLVTGTDNLIISGFLGVIIVGYYTNYMTVIYAMISLITAVFAGIISGFGNLIATSERDYVKKVFKRVQFASFVFYAVATTGIFALSGKFMNLWLTNETVLPLGVLIVICANFFITGYSNPLGNIRAAAGVFKPDRYLHIIIAVLNLVVSIVLVNFIGLAGVLLGTTLCLIIKECIVLPVLGARYVYGGKPSEYYIKLVIEFLFVAAMAALCWYITGLIVTGSALIDFILGGIICIALPALLILLIYFKTDEFKYFVDLIKRIFGGIIKKKKIKDSGDENNK